MQYVRNLVFFYRLIISVQSFLENTHMMLQLCIRYFHQWTFDGAFPKQKAPTAE